MANLIESLTEKKRLKMESRTNVELNGQPFGTFKSSIENIYPRLQATQVYQKNIGGDTLIWGNENFGIWNSFKWGDAETQSFILGLGILGLNALGDRASEFELVRVVSPNNIFSEPFLGDNFIDTSLSTAEIENGYTQF
jgi:hypothetical protein